MNEGVTEYPEPVGLAAIREHRRRPFAAAIDLRQRCTKAFPVPTSEAHFHGVVALAKALDSGYCLRVYTR